MYTALITDLDGTAVPIGSNGSDITPGTKQAIAKAIQAGKKLACATGREWEIAESVIKALGLEAPCIIEGGTRIVDPESGKTLWNKPLEKGTSTSILKIFKSQSSSGVVMHSQDVTHVPLALVDSVPSDLRFIYLLEVPERIAIAVSSAINARLTAVAHLTPCWQDSDLMDIHVTHPQATKEHAVRVWQQLENISQEETIGLGDSGNDIPIFLSSGFKVAVANATANLKELADYIAPRVDEGALKSVIEQYLL